MIAASPRRPMDKPMASAFDDNAHTRLLLFSSPRVVSVPKRKKPPRFPWVAPFRGIGHQLRKRSPPGVRSAILGREGMVRLRANHSQPPGTARKRSLFAGGDQVPAARCEIFR